MTAQVHVDVTLGALTVHPHQLWQPVVGPETVRLLDAALKDDDGRARMQKQSVEVLARCNPPASGGADPRTGLVVGYVQSGKTLSFTTVMALARDNAFPLVILFAGTKDILHQQTAKRLAADLAVEREGGLSPWYKVSNPRAGTADAQAIGQHLKHALDPKTPAKFRRTIVITVMKNRSRLDGLRQVLLGLDEHGISLSDLPVLVVDDEADQAGLNTLAADDDMSTTYTAILSLRAVLPRHSYVMYTATPQAPLLVNLADTLSPDFVAVLEPGDGYTGGRYFFEDHRTSFLKIIGAKESLQALDPTTSEPPATLQRALATFFIGLAVRQSGAGAVGPTSMLVHPSHTQDLHERYAAWVKNLCDTWAELLSDPGPDRDALIEEDLRPAYEDLATTVDAIPPFDELLTDLPYWIGVTQRRTVNSENPEESDIRWNSDPSWILVGGNKLDRGFTVEGLTVTYMPRGVGVGNADSIQQRARFFGYKGSYASLCRAWLASTTETAFTRYVDHEKVLRKELQDVATSGANLKTWKRQMLLDPAFKPCRRAVIDLPYLHSRIAGDAWSRFERIRIPDDKIDLNRSVIDAFVTSQGQHRAADPRDPRDADPNELFAVSLQDLLATVLADWRTNVEDRAGLNQLTLLLRARLDDDPDLMADVYLMRGLRRRERELQQDGVRVTNLLEGRRSGKGTDGYDGDAKYFTPGRLSIQLHSVDVMKAGTTLVESVPAFAIWVPRDLAGGVLSQQDDVQ